MNGTPQQAKKTVSDLFGPPPTTGNGAPAPAPPAAAKQSPPKSTAGADIFGGGDTNRSAHAFFNNPQQQQQQQQQPPAPVPPMHLTSNTSAATYATSAAPTPPAQQQSGALAPGQMQVLDLGFGTAAPTPPQAAPPPQQQQGGPIAAAPNSGGIAPGQMEVVSLDIGMDAGPPPQHQQQQQQRQPAPVAAPKVNSPFGAPQSAPAQAVPPMGQQQQQQNGFPQQQPQQNAFNQAPQQQSRMPAAPAAAPESTANPMSVQLTDANGKQPHGRPPCISFQVGTGGKVAVAGGNSSNTVKVENMFNALNSGDAAAWKQEIASFPGPLGNTSPQAVDAVRQYITGMQQKCRSTPNLSKEYIMWDFLNVCIQTRGDLRGQEFSKQILPMLLKAGGVSEAGEQGGPLHKVLLKVAHGNVEQGIHEAVRGQMWTHALILSGMHGAEASQHVLGAYCDSGGASATDIGGSPLEGAFKVLCGIAAMRPDIPVHN